MSKMYAQFNEEGICFCVGSPKTDVEATYDCLGKKYVDGVWVEPEIVEETVDSSPMEDSSNRGGYYNNRITFIGESTPDILSSALRGCF